MAQIGRSLGYAYDIREFGAVGDGKTENRRTIQAAIDACTAAGGGTVYCPPGRYLTGTLEIKSNVNLHLDSGATLLGSTNRGDYVTISYPLSGPPRPGATIEHLIFARKAQNVAITGLGTIDGQGDEFFEQRPGRARLSPKAWRPWRMISFLDCRNVTMENVTVRNSPAFTIWPLGCDNVIIRGVRIFNNPIGPNADGIDPDCCRGVTISNCHIDVGDDAIALKTSVDKLGRIKACEDVVVTNCTLVTTCCAVRIGYEGDAPIRNCTFSNLAISRCRTGINMLVPGHSDWKDSLITHGPAIENIRFSNLIMDTRVPLFLWIGDDAKRPGGIRNIAISDVYATTERGCFVGGTRAIPVEGLQLRNWRLEVRGEMDDEFGEKVPDPYGVWDYFDKRGIPHALYFRHARDVELHNVRVAWGKVSGAWRSAVRAQSVEGLDLNGLIARQAPGPAEAPVVHLSDVRRAHLSNCRAEPGTGTFLRLDGAATEEITSFGNELGRARSAFSFGEEVGLEWRRRLEAK